MFSSDVIDELATWLGHTQSSFPGHVEGVMVGGTDKGKSVLRLIGTAQAYSEKDADSALAIFEGCPLIGKALSRNVNIPVTTYGTTSGITPGTRQILDGVWCSAPPEKILATARDAFVKFPTPQSFMLWMHWGPPQKLKDMCYSLQGDVYLSTNAIWNNPADDERCAAWGQDVIGRLKPISNGSQMNDENMPANKGPYLSKEAAARLETLRKKYDPDRRFVGFLS
jgi:hypothetical protein